MKFDKKYIFLLIILFISTFNYSMEFTMQDEADNELYELPKDCDFMQVHANSSIETDCTPKLTDPFFSPFRGLLINAPKQVVWPSDVSIEDYLIYPDGSNDSPIRLNVYGLTNVPNSTVGLNSDAAYDVVVVAVNQETAKSYTGKMRRFGQRGPRPSDFADYPKAQEGEHDYVRTHYFNVDLVNNLNIPITEAIYTVYATLGEYKSNMLTVRTFIK